MLKIIVGNNAIGKTTYLYTMIHDLGNVSSNLMNIKQLEMRERDVAFLNAIKEEGIGEDAFDQRAIADMITILSTKADAYILDEFDLYVSMWDAQIIRDLVRLRSKTATVYMVTHEYEFVCFGDEWYTIQNNTLVKIDRERAYEELAADEKIA